MRQEGNTVVLVAGATRGVGRGVARAFGETGATVYCTGRSVAGEPSEYGRPETIGETAALVDEAGGRGIAVRVDHASSDEVARLVERIREERGRLDVLVNGVAGEDPRLGGWGTPLAELDLGGAEQALSAALLSHLIAARHGAPLMAESGGGLMASITEFDLPCGGGNTALGELVKGGLKVLAFRLAEDLREQGVAVVSATPGYLRSERMLEHFGVSEGNWRDAGEQDEHFLQSETPLYLGRGLVALAADEDFMRYSGALTSSWELADRYDLRDVDGRQPRWGPYFTEILPEIDWVQEPLRRQIQWLEAATERARGYLAKVDS